MAKHVPPPSDSPSSNVETTPLREALEERYLAYALSTIMGRALPDARDGLKPVHRRILYGMQILKLDPASAFKKSAKIVGDVMGSFHPHGDQAIYDALVRLAQDFSSRYPLVEGQGNFGNIDGDAAAAYRYTEARMTEVARLLLEGIDESAVDFRDNYSGDAKEPVVLPAALPNLLANGSQGIAVGMATSIPPHNLAELCDAALHLIAHPHAQSEDLLRFVPGPDFPTGGVLIESKENIAEAYRTGRGGFRLRARWSVEEGPRGTWIAVVTEIPYGVQKSRLIEKLAELFNEKKLPLLADIRDESAEDVRVVFEPRTRNVDPATMMETLFRSSELETRVPLNMNVLVDGVVPRVVNLAEALKQWLDHRRVVLQRRSRHRLGQIDHRLETLSGMIIAYLNLDEVIRIIREEDEPKDELKKAFKLSDVQANYILDTRLRSLRKLEEMELRREHEALTKEKTEIEGLLSSDAKQWKQLAWEIGDLKKRFGPKTKIGARRTSFADAPNLAAIDIEEALVEREPITVVLSEKGWARALKGHVADLSSLSFKGDDALKAWLHAETTSKILLFASNGKVFTLDGSKLPGGRGFGEPVRLMADVDEGAEIVQIALFTPGAKRLVVSSEGRGFIASEDEMIAGTRKGKALLNVDAPATLKLIAPVEGDHVAIIGENRKLLVYPLNQTPEMPRGKGVRLQRYVDGGVSDAKTFALKEGLSWQDTAGRTFTVAHAELRDWIGNRADAGRLPPKGFPKSNRFA
jgi:topoisomerase-4 subunit A